MPYNDLNDPGNGPQWHTGKVCVTLGCENPAGTAWSPYWCVPCNIKRIDRIDKALEEAEKRLTLVRLTEKIGEKNNMTEDTPERIRKIKWEVGKKKDEKDRLTIVYDKQRGDKWDSLSITSVDEALPTFYAALSELRYDVIDLCELGRLADMAEHPIVVTGVTWTYSGPEDTPGATIIAARKLKKSHSPLVLNTPHKAMVGVDPKSVLPVETIARLTSLHREAVFYIRGYRAQEALFDLARFQNDAKGKEAIDVEVMQDGAE